jgi:hypothetical protein
MIRIIFRRRSFMNKRLLLILTALPLLTYAYEDNLYEDDEQEKVVQPNRRTPSRQRLIAQDEIEGNSRDVLMDDTYSDEEEAQDDAAPVSRKACPPKRVKKCRPKPRNCRPEPCCREPKPCPVVVERPCCTSKNPCCDPCSNPIGIKVKADYLFWAACEDNLEYAMYGITPYFVGETQASSTSGYQLNGTVVDPSPSQTGKIERIPTKWKSGFRVGFGYDFTGSPWSMDVLWTWYQNSSHRGTSSPAQPATGTFSNSNNNVWPDSLYPEFGTGVANHVTARWKLHYNTLDLRWLRLIQFGDDFSFNPHIGLRGAWINQRYKVKTLEAQTQLSATNFYRSTESNVRMQSDYSGLGFRTGFDSAFDLGAGFSFFGNASATLLLSDFHVKDKATIASLSSTSTDGNPYTFFNFREQFTCLKPEFETALGFKWETGFKCDRYHLAIDLGYEYLLWVDQNQMSFKFPSVRPSSSTSPVQGNGLFVREGGNLSLHGVTAGLAFSF